MSSHASTLKSEKAMIGQKYGLWTVIAIVRDQKPKNPRRSVRRLIKVRCECGKTKNVDKFSILRGQSSGCKPCKSRFVDYSGKEYEGFKVIRFLGYIQSRTSKRALWELECKICRTLFKPGQAFYHYIKTQRPCKKCSIKQQHMDSSGNPQEIAINIMLSTYKSGAAVRNLCFDLSIEYFTEIILQKCYYCSKAHSRRIKYSNVNGKYFGFVNGIDRVDNSLGYIVGNVVACCTKCNEIKRDVPKHVILRAASFLNDNAPINSPTS